MAGWDVLRLYKGEITVRQESLTFMLIVLSSMLKTWASKLRQLVPGLEKKAHGWKLPKLLKTEDY